MLRIVEAVDALLPGVPPCPLIWQALRFCHIQDMAFFSLLLKKMPPAQAPYLASRGESPSGLPLRAASVDAAQGALPLRSIEDHALMRNVLYGATPRRPPSDLASHRHCYSASVTVLPAGGFVLGAPRPQSPRQGARPLHPPIYSFARHCFSISSQNNIVLCVTRAIHMRVMWSSGSTAGSSKMQAMCCKSSYELREFFNNSHSSHT